jgi:hypothetical protein
MARVTCTAANANTRAALSLGQGVQGEKHDAADFFPREGLKGVVHRDAAVQKQLAPLTADMHLRGVQGKRAKVNKYSHPNQ